MGCADSKPKAKPAAGGPRAQSQSPPKAQGIEQPSKRSPSHASPNPQVTEPVSPRRGTLDPHKVAAPPGAPAFDAGAKPSTKPSTKQYTKAAPLNVIRKSSGLAAAPGSDFHLAVAARQNSSPLFVSNASSYVKSASPPPTPPRSFSEPKSPTRVVQQLSSNAGPYPGRDTGRYDDGNLPPPNVLLPSVRHPEAKPPANLVEKGAQPKPGDDGYTNKFGHLPAIAVQSTTTTSDHRDRDKASLSSGSSEGFSGRGGSKATTRTPRRASRGAPAGSDAPVFGPRTGSMMTSVSQRPVVVLSEHGEDSVFGAPSNAFTHSRVGVSSVSFRNDSLFSNPGTAPRVLSSHESRSTVVPPVMPASPTRSVTPDVVHCLPCSVSPTKDYTETMYKGTRMVLCVPVNEQDLDSNYSTAYRPSHQLDLPLSPSQRAHASRQLYLDSITTPRRL
eukprot:TRINITY_DN27682_c0_g3_i1.p1 TRINITY_DN27682_c0_g3~~TRINITY_DN27682_c0_g3_i1.p1  ORF type:complete len:445 (+),score=94.82 TRINITY_DN27682_c0_g3_i1:172-1506(+)